MVILCERGLPCSGESKIVVVLIEERAEDDGHCSVVMLILNIVIFKICYLHKYIYLPMEYILDFFCNTLMRCQIDGRCTCFVRRSV